MTIADSPSRVRAGVDAAPGLTATGTARASATASPFGAAPGDATASTVAGRALERVLGALEWRVTETRVIDPSLDGPAWHRGGHPVMLYVTGGSVRVRQRVVAEVDGAAVGPAVGTRGPGDGQLASCSRELNAGDLALSVAGRPFELVADDPAAHVILSDLAFAGTAPFALGTLPSMLVVRDFATHEPAVAGLAAAMGNSCEERRSRIADSVVCAHIATTVVAVAVRAWSELGCAPGDWLLRTDDPRLARVLDAIHGDPGHAWSVGELATVGAMSRSVFAERFRNLVGQSPASYLTAVRMAHAKAMLQRDGLSVAAVAHQLGYESEAGFSRAFRRHTGHPPAAWRQRAVAGATAVTVAEAS
ncbi:hypothetical protein GCM10011490_21380 [Pseudoclavibacter endophyticus]|uniref:Helix-turn-helix transcriptional regulator n=1 Tax=Pseudoclavibacter endophyticus TaxID=1778590 RepID=A0A6H9WI85_9MICO|nr:AraC family transcriptional regulator [Pseudoclavibacter endophyticus]KAB1648187.1 helix-turn-helix transcriptional regulator [Pseudoclavibacter endophyticus]GGA70488.1 hypothetical protein GCM10011490_21380 [Pseudoclavibacter endophyticus]